MLTEIPDFQNCIKLQGHINNIGKDAGIVKNEAYHDQINNVIYIKCNDMYYTIIDAIDYNHTIIVDGKRITWYQMTNGYVGAHIKINFIEINIYLHYHILNNIKPKPGLNYSVDHINGNKLDNRRCNLRWADQSLQNKNMDKRARKHNAKPLPAELDKIIKDCKDKYNKFNIVDKSKATAFQLWVNNDENVLSKYIEYMDEVYNKEKGLRRQFFRINKHPSGNIISSSKSGAVSMENKFNDIIEKLMILEAELNNRVINI